MDNFKEAKTTESWFLMRNPHDKNKQKDFRVKFNWKLVQNHCQKQAQSPAT